MIGIINYNNSRLPLRILQGCFSNSFGNIKIINKKKFNENYFLNCNLIILIDTKDNDIQKIFNFCEKKKIKVIIFGSLSEISRKILFSRKKNLNFNVSKLNTLQAIENKSSNSYYHIKYNKSEICKFINKRYFERYDFLKEWNNMGYGKIDLKDKFLGISQSIELKKKNQIAYISDKKNNVYGSYVGLWKNKKCVLWFNRRCGPFDSFEWRLIENFVSNLNYDNFKCIPNILEIPYKYEGVATARLDCDENISSAKFLCNQYFKKKIPISLAIVTNLLEDKKNIELPTKVLRKRGSILSHSKSHPNNWGGNIKRATWEAIESRNDIYRHLKIVCRYAVSPFHENPRFVNRILKKAGYKGLASGIIKNDPLMLISRAGKLFNESKSFISLSQQCMLHGDIIKSKKDLKKIFKTVNIFKKSNMIFGYLDHPFSKRYKYGWPNEKFRYLIHMELIKFLKKKKFKFLSLNRVMDFILQKQMIKIKVKEHSINYTLDHLKDNLSYALEYKDKKYELKNKLNLKI